MKKVPDYVINSRKVTFAQQVEKVLRTKEKPNTLREHCYDKGIALPILEEFADTYKYGVLPDKLVCYRIFVDDEKGNAGELGLTFVPVYKCWEFYFKGIDKNCRAVANFRKHLAEYNFKLKRV